MFSGLIAHRAIVVNNQESNGGRTLQVRCGAAVSEGIVPKDSIAINGVCLTATRVLDDRIDFDVVPETLERSTLGRLAAGDAVNLELSLRVGDRIGGHFVYGHVDATARVIGLAAEGQGARMTLECPAALCRFICEKGYVSLDGVSLTVAAASGNRFEVALIPETLSRTTMGARKPGDHVNLEIDPIARYAVSAADTAIEHSAAELEWAYEI